MKTAKIMNVITATVTSLYLFLTTFFWIFIVIEDNMGSYDCYSCGSGVDGMLSALLFIGILFAGAILVLGIITLIMNTLVKNGGSAKPLAITASSMAIGGFIIGWIPVLSGMYMIITIILLFIAAVNMKKQDDL